MLNDKEIPVIPPLFRNNNFISNVREKRELFNEHFSEQCSLIQNKSAIPSVFTRLTHNLLSSFQFTGDDIKSIINKLDPNNAHLHDMINVRMIKLCGDSIYKLLEMVFKSCLNQGVFPAEWKKANVVSVYKKWHHQCMKNYRPVSLLPVFSKIFERLIYNAMFKNLLDNNLISSNQSGCKPGDACMNQLIAITHEIFKGFDDGLEIRSVFLDISKAFDKVWHEGLIY